MPTPIRILALVMFWLVSLNAQAATYYVSTTGSNTGNSAIASRDNPASPWRTVQAALDVAVDGDIILIASGTYNEYFYVRQSVTISKWGTGTNPIIAPTVVPTIPPVNISPGVTRTFVNGVVNIRTTNVTLSNLDIWVTSGAGAKNGIVGDSIQGGYSTTNPSNGVPNVRINGLKVLKCNIYSTGNGNSTTLDAGTYAINLRGSFWSNGGTDQVDKVTIKGCTIAPLNAGGNRQFERGILLEGPYGVVGDDTAANRNTITVYYKAVAINSTKGGAVSLTGNTINGVIEVNNPAATSTATITLPTTTIVANNIISNPSLEQNSLIECKGFNRPNTALRIKGNVFNNFTGYGIFCGTSKDVSIIDNGFNPLPSSPVSTCIGLNTAGQRTGGAATLISTGISAIIQQNTFNGKIGIEIGNGQTGATPAVDTIIIGGAGSLANTFNSGMFRAIRYLTPVENTTVANAAMIFANPAAYGYVNANINASLNKFATTGAAVRTPGQMTSADELYKLEDLISHLSDNDGSGFVTVKANNVYVTDSSRSVNLGNAPGLRRLLPVLNESFVINTRVGNINESLTFTKSGTIKADGVNASVLRLTDFIINGTGKVITIDGCDLNVSDSLGLLDGIISTSGNVTATGTGRQIGGSATSYVYLTAATSVYSLQTVGTATLNFAVGSKLSGGYSPVSVRDQLSSDDIVKVRVVGANSSGAFNPPLPIGIAQYVKKQWFLDEGVAGGGNYTVTFNWLAGDQTVPFNGALQGTVGKSVNQGAWAETSQGITGTNTSIAGQTSLVDAAYAVYSAARINGAKYYVNSTTTGANRGDNIRTLTEARRSATPWRDLETAIDRAADYDTIVLYGETGQNYVGNFIVNKKLTIRDTLSSPLRGGNRPTLSCPVAGRPSTVSNSVPKYIVRIDSSDVTIRGLRIVINCNDINLLYGILVDSVNGAQANNLLLDNNQILSSGTAGFYFSKNAVFLQPKTSQAFLLRKNLIAPINPTSLATAAILGYGIRIKGFNGVIGGNSPSDSNSISAYNAVLWGDAAGGTVVIKNNKFAGQGLQINNVLRSVASVDISNNKFDGFNNSEVYTSLQFKDLDAGVPINVQNNDFFNHYWTAIWSQRANNVFVKNNTFTPAVGHSGYTHIHANTLHVTSVLVGAQQPFANGISIQGNTFNSNAGDADSSVAIELANYDGRSSFSSNDVVIGGAGALANNFTANLKTVFKLNSLIGRSIEDPLYSRNSAQDTATAPVQGNFDLSNNNFNLGSGLQLPSALTEAQLFSLEDKIVHGIDQDSIGFVTVVPRRLFITPNSFTTQWSNNVTNNAALLSRGFRYAVDGDTILSSNLNFTKATDKANIISNVWLRGVGGTVNAVKISGATATGKVLTLKSDIKVKDSLIFASSAGVGSKINTRIWALRLASRARVAGGSDNSYVITANGGRMIKDTVRNTATLFPIGTASTYAPVTFQDANNTVDSITARVNATVTVGSFNPALPATITKFANFQWNVSEGVEGGSNATLGFTWPSANETSGPITDPLVSVANFTNGAWAFTPTAVTAVGAASRTASVSGITDLKNFAVVKSLTPIVTIATNDTVICAGDTIRVRINTSATLDVTNTYNVQLSDASGVFSATPTSLANITSNISIDTTVIVFNGTVAGTGYRLRVLASNGTPLTPITSSPSFQTILVNVRPARPTITSNNGNTLCGLGDSLTLAGPTAAVIGGTPTWEWRKTSAPGTIIATTQTLVVRDSAIYVLRVSSGLCPSDTAHFRLGKKLKTTTPVVTTTPTGPVCSGTTVTLSVPAVAGATYRWSNGATTASISVVVTANRTLRVSTTEPAKCPSDSSIAVTITVIPPPAAPVVNLTAARPGGPSTNQFCAGDSIRLTTPSAGPRYLWSNGRTTQSIFVSASGTFTLRTINAQGCTSVVSAAQAIQVDTLPSRPTITSSTPSICQGSSATLTAPAGYTQYIWFGPSNPAPSAVNTITTTIAGSFRVIITNGNGCSSDTSAPFNISIATPPVQATITNNGSNTICTGQTVQLTAGGGVGNIKYVWSLGGTVFDTTSQVVTVRTGGSYTVFMIDRVTGCQGLPSNATTIIVTPPPAKPTFTVDPTDGIICDRAVATLTAPAGFASYIWSNGATTANTTVDTTSSITLQVVSATGCTSAISDPVQITRLPQLIPTISVTGNLKLCAAGNGDGRDSVELTSSSTINNVWSNGQTTQSIIVRDEGSYSVQVTNARGCIGTSLPVVVTKSEPIVLSFATTPAVEAGSNRVIIPKGESVTITSTVLPATGTFTYQWRNAAGSVEGIDNPTSPSIRVTPNTSDAYTLTVTDENGCTQSSNLLTGIRVIVADGIYIPNYFSPNGDGINDFFSARGYGVKSITLEVYNKFGGLVWSTIDPNIALGIDINNPSILGNGVAGWDGTKDGVKLQPDTYLWTLKGKTTNEKDLKTFDGKNSGQVTLGR